MHLVVSTTLPSSPDTAKEPSPIGGEDVTPKLMSRRFVLSFSPLLQDLARRLTTPQTCEICENPEKCLAGECPCDLAGAFIAPVPPELANKMMIPFMRVQNKTQIAAAIRRPGMYAGEQGQRTQEEWAADAVHAVLTYDGQIIDMEKK